MLLPEILAEIEVVQAVFVALVAIVVHVPLVVVVAQAVMVPLMVVEAVAVPLTVFEAQVPIGDLTSWSLVYSVAQKVTLRLGISWSILPSCFGVVCIP